MATDPSNANFDICFATELLRTRRTLAGIKAVRVTYRGLDNCCRQGNRDCRSAPLSTCWDADIFFLLRGMSGKGNLINIQEDLSPDAHWHNNILCPYSQTETVLEGQGKVCERGGLKARFCYTGSVRTIGTANYCEPS